MTSAISVVITHNEDGCRLWSQGLYSEACDAFGRAKTELQPILNDICQRPLEANGEDQILYQQLMAGTEGNDFLSTPQGSVYSTPISLHGLEESIHPPLQTTELEQVVARMQVAVRFNVGIVQHLVAIVLRNQGKCAAARAILSSAMTSYIIALPFDRSFCHGRVVVAVYNNLAHVSQLLGDKELAISYAKELSTFLSDMVVSGFIATDQSAYQHFRENVEQIRAAGF
jgi:hypothetical protein